MAKPNKNQAEASKIVNGWRKKVTKFDVDFGETYMDCGRYMEEILEAKKAINDGEIMRGIPIRMDDLKKYAEYIQAFQKVAQKSFKDFDAWVKKEPAQGMAYLDKNLKLGGKRSQAYKDVEKDQGKTLKDIAKLVGQVQKKYYKPITRLIKQQFSDLKFIATMLKSMAKN